MSQRSHCSHGVSKSIIQILVPLRVGLRKSNVDRIPVLCVNVLLSLSDGKTGHAKTIEGKLKTDDTNLDHPEGDQSLASPDSTNVNCSGHCID